jgi:tetraacyldisaccharide 4'-kinase
MLIEEPRWWYGSAWPGLATLLQPVAAVYGRVAEARYRRTRPYRSRLPVICVGNLVAGGTGKTPLALWIARHLQAQGHAPAFLSRGYGGSRTGPHRVDPVLDMAPDVGDEPLLLAQTASAFIARDRAAGARMIEGTDATHIIMDDGLQNPGLAKDLSLAMIDGARWIGNGRVIPAGPLRAPLAFQAGLVDALVIGETGNSGQDLPALLSRHFSCPVLWARRMPDGCAIDLRDKPWVAFAGIGRPEGFFQMLEEDGARIAARVPFADHHPFSQGDAERLIALAETHHAGLITTEKDWVRLLADTGALGRLKTAAQTLKLQFIFSENDQIRLQGLLARLIR